MNIDLIDDHFSCKSNWLWAIMPILTFYIIFEFFTLDHVCSNNFLRSSNLIRIRNALFVEKYYERFFSKGTIFLWHVKLLWGAISTSCDVFISQQISIIVHKILAHTLYQHFLRIKDCAGLTSKMNDMLYDFLGKNSSTFCVTKFSEENLFLHTFEILCLFLILVQG